MTLRLCLIGPGDVEFHYSRLLGISKDSFKEQVNGIANAIARAEYEIVLLPDRGVCFEVAREYKKAGGRRVVGTVPLSDKDFGISHLKPFMNAEANGQRVFDEFVNTENWYKQDLTHCIFGDVILMLGNSLGAMGELVYGYYLYKLFTGGKPEVKAKAKAIHPEARAGENVPYSVIVYEPFIIERLNSEIEEYVKKTGGRVYYARDPRELEQTLSRLKQDAERE